MKKEITFDFAKWGQDGISIKDTQFEVVTIVESTTKNLFMCELKTSPTARQIAFVSKCNLRMFEEVKPREFWVNVYPKYPNSLHSSEQAAMSGLENTWNNSNVKGETIKVREVIE